MIPNHSSLLTEAYDIENDGGVARVTISVLAGQGGDVLPNINRWRRQIGMQPITNLDQQPVEFIIISTGQRAVLVDLIGPNDDQGGQPRILAAMIIGKNQSWFFKMTGPKSAIDLETNTFKHFVISHKLK